MSIRIVFIFFIIFNMNNNIIVYSYDFCIAPKSFLDNKMSNYLNLEIISNRLNDEKFRNEFKRNLLSANHNNIIFWLDNIEVESQYKFEIELLKKAIYNLVFYIKNGKNKRAFSDFSVQILTYKTLLIFLKANRTAVNITKELLKNIIDYTFDPKNRKYEGNIKGVAGVISGIFEVSIKKGTLLIDIPLIKKVNVFVSENENVNVHEWDALSNNSVFEFKFTARLNSLYSQILGIDRTHFYLRSISDGDNDFINKFQIVNLIYFGENASKELSRAIMEYKENRNIIFNHSQEKGISIRFSIEEFISFLKDENTLKYLKEETNEFQFLTRELIENHVNKNIKKYLDALKERSLKQGKQFDIIIAVSNPFVTNNHNFLIQSNNQIKKSA